MGTGDFVLMQFHESKRHVTIRVRFYQYGKHNTFEIQKETQAISLPLFLCEFT
jgi:hypothetical protein